MAFVVYILYSDKHDIHYVGYTSDLESRIKSHNELCTKGFTLKYRPWRLIHTESFITKTEAMKREKYLKSGVGRVFVKGLAH